LSHSPLFQVLFSLEERDDTPAGLAGLQVRHVGLDVETAKFDLSLGLAASPRGLAAGLSYRTDLFERDTIVRMLRHFAGVLDQMVANVDARLSALTLLDATERAQVVDEWNKTDDEACLIDRCIHQLFEAQAAQTPTAIAAVCGGAALTYGELNARADRLAHHLRRLGVGPDVPVAIYLERRLELVSALLGVLKAGGAYVPLDPSYPAERLAFMLTDANVRVLLTQDSLRAVAPLRPGVPVVSIDEVLAAAVPDTLADRPIGSGANPRSLAYVIYTSGSTGVPKGVAIEHRSVVRLVRSANYVSLGPETVMLQAAPVSFDASTLELWGPLLNGGRLVLIEESTPSLEAIGAALVTGGVNTMWLTAGLFHVMAEERLEDLRGVRQLLAGGDVLPVEAVRRVQRRFPDLRVINGYGPTENTTFTCCYTVPAPGVQGDAAAPIPIGSPIANTRVYVLDAAGEPVPVGIPGELYAGGAGVARGYLERPGLTAERFVPDPFSPVPGGRAYRTGDRARWRPDGTLSYLGRRDGQVKIRGFRIELGEVETALRQQPGVADAVAVVREDTRGERQLVAYIVGGRDVDAIRTHLGGRLPEHMVPAAFVPLDRLPLTPNGKLNRQALPAPVFESHRHAEHATPSSSPIEEVVAGIWAEVLRLDRFGVTDNFFALGGHSLLAMRVVSRLRDTLGVEIPLRTLFEHPTVRGLSRQLQSIREGTQAIRLPALAPVAHAGAIPPSFAQERLWFLDRLEPGAATYNVVVPRRLIGALDLSALERALPEIFRRHDVLRTRFVSVDGAPTQVIASGCGFALSHVDLSTLDARDRDTEVHRIIRAETVQPFDLATGPLFRATLIHLDAADHVLLLEMHHIVCDGWSLAVLFRELDALYDAYRAGRESPLADLPVQYADYAVWQRAHLRGEVLEAQLAHWRAQLSNLPALLALPTDHPRPATQTYDGAYEQVELPAELLSGLRALGRREGATLYMVLLAAFQVLLGKYAGTEDVVVGAPIAGRTRRELEGLIGFFVNSLVLRTDLSGDPDVRAILRRVREVTLDAYEHQDVPFEQLVGELQPERSLSHTPLFQVVFTLQEDDDALKPAGMSGLEVREIGLDVRTVKFDLQLSVTANGRGLVTGLSYRTDLFERDTIARMLRHLARVLEQMAGDPGLRLSDVQLLGPAERDQVLDAWNAPPEEAPDGAWCLHERFEAQAARTPEAVALIHGEETLSYGELNARANQLARRLIGLGVGPDVRVALCLERSPRLIVSLLAVLKAGGAYVPLDPRYPAERLALMLADSGAAVLVTDEIGSAAVTVPDGITDVCVDRDAAELAGEHAGNPPPAAMPGHLAYVIYTSGSTGVPKGVLIEHRQVARLFTATGAWFDFGPHDVWTLFHSYAFDFSVWEIWGALLYGGRLVIVPHEVSRDLATFHALVLHAGVTVLNQTPSAFRQFIGADGESGGELALRLVIFGGEALEPASLREWVARHGIDRPRLVNMYGITETTVHVTYAPLSLDDVEESARSPIGSRIPDLQLYVLDRAGQPVPIGVPGELYVGGGGVTRGYLNRPALTAQRFVPNPFGAGRLYRTGDLVRRASDGTLNYLGRLDAQVKIRGFRIELGEIEARLCQHEDVDECVVMVREDVIGDKRLVAYVVGEADAPALRAHLRRTLPDYMVPAAFVPLDRLPLTSNGKLHREALPAPDYGEPSREIHAPTNFLEVQLIQIWEELLEVEVNDPTLNFFELGGHSLLAMKLVAQIRRRLHYELPVTTLFAGATVRQMAKAILEQQQLAGTAPSAIVPMQPQGALPPLFCVHPGDRRVLIYTSVVRHFGTNQPMLGLQDLGEDLSRPIPRIAAEYVDAIRSVRPEGPYDLLGWSFGGFVAYEIASQLERQGETVSFLGLMDTIHPDMTRGWITDDLDMLIGIARDVATRARRSFSIDRRELEPLDWEEQFNRVLDALHAQGVPASFDAAGYRDYYDTLQKRLVSTYRYVPGPCSVPITLFRASTSDIDRDPFFAMKTEIERWTLGWSRISSNVNVHPVPGAHSTIGAEPHVRVLVPLMRDLMARARADVIHRPCAVQLASMTESLCP
jgi:amino acid adenylation domain-containing protein